MREKLKEMIVTILNIPGNKSSQIDENTNLLEYGLDSLTCVEIVVFIEEEFGIEISEDDLIIDNMSTIGKIELLIKKYLV